MNKPKRWFAGKLRWTIVVSLALHASVFAWVLLPGDKEQEHIPDPTKLPVTVIFPEKKLPPPPTIDPEPAPPIPANVHTSDLFEVVPDTDADRDAVWDPNAADRLTPELPDGREVVVKPTTDPNDPPEVTFVDYQVAPTMIKEVKPHYPEMAAASGLEADVILLVYINANGDVEHVVVQGSSGFGTMDEEAVKAAKKCKFSPALQNGRPVAVWYSLVMEFRQ
ncbi:MAG: TonB family protein [Candidatus Coatesbacteria bacterium]|nr:MAG: TonB family protein [Candidatus Coatesbacteria bacterium]